MQKARGIKQGTAGTEEQTTIKRKIGKATYIVSLHFSKDSIENVQDKLRRIIINDCMNGKEMPD